MSRGVTEPHFLNGKGGRLGKHGRAVRSRRAVSDVVATILLLALTVVLFASIFAFVTAFPGPPAQNSNQFQANLIQGVNTSGSCTGACLKIPVATSITITHLSGPAVPMAALIYIKSAVHPIGPEFRNPYSLTAGGIPAGETWNLGQTWVLNANFTGGDHPTLPDNFTIYIVSVTSLLFSVILPGAVINLPPTFVAVGTTPTAPVVGQGFTIFAQIQGPVPTSPLGSVLITVSGIPGMANVTTPQKMQYSAATGLWTYSMLAGNTTASGTYYAFITATTTVGLVGTAAVSVPITPYSLSIGGAITLSSAVTTGSCAVGSAQTVPPVAATKGGCKAGDYIYTLTITSSSVTFSSILLQVRSTSTNTVLTATASSSFAILTSASVVAAITVPGSGAAFAMPTPWAGYNGGLAPAITGSSPLTTSYTIVIDSGGTVAIAPVPTLVVLGDGSYTGSFSVTL